MILNKKVLALLQLMDDPDIEVFHTVSEQLLKYGTDIVPTLEKMWETTLDEGTQNRIEELIKKTLFEKVKEEFLDWVKEPDPNLLKGAMIIAKYEFPQFDTNLFLSNFDQIKRNVWLEMSMFLTPLEQINILNSIIYSYYKIESENTEHAKPHLFAINYLLDFNSGNAISIGILYLSLCEVLDIPIFAVNIPMQFLLGFFDNLYHFYAPDSNPVQSIQFYIDPEHGMVHSSDDILHFLKTTQQADLFNDLKALNNKEVIDILLKELALAYEQGNEQEKKTDMQYLSFLLHQYL